jgi:N-methylhydantoinase A/oxoprolinase/acetone carboxylase beta subunit
VGLRAARAIDHLGETAKREARAGPGTRREVYLANGFVSTPIYYRTALPPGARLDGPA